MYSLLFMYFCERIYKGSILVRRKLNLEGECKVQVREEIGVKKMEN